MTNHTSAIYAKNETKLSGPIGLGAICDKQNKKGNYMINHADVVYVENETELS